MGMCNDGSQYEASSHKSTLASVGVYVLAVNQARVRVLLLRRSEFAERSQLDGMSANGLQLLASQMGPSCTH